MILYNLLFLITFCSGLLKPDDFLISSDNPEIIIIGTVHEESDNFSKDTLLNIFNKIKPNLILVECDTSYMTSDFRIKEEFEYMFPETGAISDYNINSSVKIRPYDLNGRDLFLDNAERLSIQAEFFNELALTKNIGNLTAEAENLYNRIEEMILSADELSRSGLSFINSKEGSAIADTINYYTYNGLKKLIELTPELSKFKDYWDKEYSFFTKRNETMLENILKYQAQFKNKRIIVLCGFAHKNYLKKNLSRLSDDNGFEVKEYYEY